MNELSQIRENISGPVRAWEAEGARVGLCSCRICGAAILLDPSETVDVLELHRVWHRRVGESNG